MNDKASELAAKCIECGLCADSCRLLAELGTSPRQVAERGPTAWEAFSCALCGACQAACPGGLSPGGMFAEVRRQAVETGDFDPEEYRELLPDRANNLVNVYRRFSGIDYSDIELKDSAASAFFPGCMLTTYAPELTRAVYARLQARGCGGILVDCCGKPLSQLGLARRAEDATQKLLGRLTQLNLRELIVACPGCYYELRPIMEAAGIRLRTVYEVLDIDTFAATDKRLTVHDSCPDRFAGLFGRQVRGLLVGSGFATVEMAHSRQNTICCGSGGMLSHFRPELTAELIGQRLAEARAAGADVLVSYCLSCVLKYAPAAGEGLSVVHALSLLLGRQDNFADAKEKLAKMLEGPQGAEIRALIMAD